MKDTSTSIRAETYRRQFICLVVLMLGLSVSTQAQDSSTTSGTTPLGIAKGAPAGSYALSGFESVNPYNGALNFRLPLLHVGGSALGTQYNLCRSNTGASIRLRTLDPLNLLMIRIRTGGARSMRDSAQGRW